MDPERVEPRENAALVLAARAGDTEAFARLVRAHQDGVFTLALRLVGNRELAADIAQEAFVRAWRSIDGFRGDAKFSTWLHRITVNTAWSLRRRAMRHRTVPLDEVTAAPVDPGTSPEQGGEAVHLRRDIRAALARLPRSQRTVVVLKDVYGWTHAEIAAELGITVSAAKVRLHRARSRLREWLWTEET